jgi:hypothetical protein
MRAIASRTVMKLSMKWRSGREGVRRVAHGWKRSSTTAGRDHPHAGDFPLRWSKLDRATAIDCHAFLKIVSR